MEKYKINIPLLLIFMGFILILCNKTGPGTVFFMAGVIGGGIKYILEWL